MSDNPLMSQAPAAPLTGAANPFQSGPSAQSAQPSQQQTIEPADLPGHIDQANYLIPRMGALARNPDTTRKDVIKAITGVIADGRLQPSDAINILSQMPEKPDQLHVWLMKNYQHLLAGAVTLNAAHKIHQAHVMTQQQLAAMPPNAA